MDYLNAIRSTANNGIKGDYGSNPFYEGLGAGIGDYAKQKFEEAGKSKKFNEHLLPGNDLIRSVGKGVLGLSPLAAVVPFIDPVNNLAKTAGGNNRIWNGFVNYGPLGALYEALTEDPEDEQPTGTDGS